MTNIVDHVLWSDPNRDSENEIKCFRNLLSAKQIESLSGKDIVIFRERYNCLSDDAQKDVEEEIRANQDITLHGIQKIFDAVDKPRYA